MKFRFRLEDSDSNGRAGQVGVDEPSSGTGRRWDSDRQHPGRG